MPELNPEEQLLRMALTFDGGQYRLDRSSNGFPTLESLVKYYVSKGLRFRPLVSIWASQATCCAQARKSRDPLGLALQLSGPFSTQRRQRSPENVQREATLKRIRPGQLSPGSPGTQRDHVTLLRNHLPCAHGRGEFGL